MIQRTQSFHKKEVLTENHDPRFRGNPEILRKCNFFGVTTNNSKSKADKLYSPHLPFVHYDEQWIRFYKQAGFCGQESSVYSVKKSSLEQAMKIAVAHGVSCEPSGIAGLALMLQIKQRLPRDKKMLIINTGKTKFL